MGQEVTKSKEERILDKAADKVIRADLDKEAKKEKNDFTELVEAYKNFQPPKQGDVIDTKVVQVTNDGMLLDMGTKSEGFMPCQEFSQKEDKKPEVGDQFKSYISGKDKNGQFLLSKKEADLHLNWAKFEAAFEEGKNIQVKVEKVVKGGLLASLGVVKAFIPASHVSLQKENNLERFIGRNLTVRVIELEKRSNNIVLSHKFVLLEEREKRKEKTLAGLEEGNTVMGKVSSITKFGVFVDLGGIDGLIYPESLSWGWVNDPYEVVSVGQKIRVRILKLDREKRKISLGLKQTKPDPWTLAEEKYRIGSNVVGKVTHLTNFGAFIEIEEGLEGLLHASDISWDRRIAHPKEVLVKGKKAEVKILDIDVKKKRISLGLKQTEPDPWKKLLGEYGVGDKVSGRVEQITNFGVFVNLAPGVDGFIHISELDKEYTSHPGTVTSVGSQIEARIVEIDTQKRRIRLSIRQLRERENREEAGYVSPKEDEIVIGDFVEEKIKEKLKGNFGK